MWTNYNDTSGCMCCENMKIFNCEGKGTPSVYYDIEFVFLSVVNVNDLYDYSHIWNNL